MKYKCNFLFKKNYNYLKINKIYETNEANFRFKILSSFKNRKWSNLSSIFNRRYNK